MGARLACPTTKSSVCFEHLPTLQHWVSVDTKHELKRAPTPYPARDPRAAGRAWVCSHQHSPVSLAPRQSDCLHPDSSLPAFRFMPSADVLNEPRSVSQSVEFSSRACPFSAGGPPELW